MSKRSFAEITTAEILIQLAKPNKRQKLEMLAKKRTLNKRRFNGGKSLTAKVNRIIDKRIETKFNVDNFSQTDILGTPLFQEVTAITQGAGEGQRIGNQINPTWVESKLAFIAPTTGFAIPFVRIMVVQSRREALVVADMPTAIGENPDYDQMNIFYDKLIAFPVVGGDVVVASPAAIAWNYQKVLKRVAGVKQTVQYDSNDGNAGAGGIYIFAIGGDVDIDVTDGYITLKYKDG